MSEHEEEYERLIAEEPSDTTAAVPVPPIHHALVRGCRYERQRPGYWSFWVGDVRWGFSLRPQRRLFRKEELVVGIGQVLCLDDAILFALGYEEGVQDMARERKEGLS